MTDLVLVEVGTVTRPHGVRGELKVREAEGSSGAWRQAREIYIGHTPETACRFALRRARPASRFVLVTLGEIDRIEQAELLREQTVYVARDQLPLPEEGAYYACDLIGLTVRTPDGRVLGVLSEIFDNGAHELYAIRDGDRELLLPVVEGVVREVDEKRGFLIVEPPEGLSEGQ